MRPDIIAETLFIVAILLTVASLLVYGLIIRRLLVLIKGKVIWIFPVAASAGLLSLALIHAYRMFFHAPMLSVAGPADLFDLIVGALCLMRVEAFILLGSGIAALIGGLLYFRASSK